MRISEHARSLNSTDRGLQVCEEKAGLQKRNPVEVEVMNNCQVLVLLFRNETHDRKDAMKLWKRTRPGMMHVSKSRRKVYTKKRAIRKKIT